MMKTLGKKRSELGKASRKSNRIKVGEGINEINDRKTIEKINYIEN